MLIIHIGPVKVLIFGKLFLLVGFEPLCKIHGVDLELGRVQLIIRNFGDAVKVLLGVPVDPNHQVDDLVGIGVLLLRLLELVKRPIVYRVVNALTLSSALRLNPRRRMQLHLLVA